MFANAKTELIDTLWNVNKLEAIVKMADALGINRYIMECKFIKVLTRATGHDELIDTLWNVNILGILLYPISGNRINRYIMECKSDYTLEN